MFDKSFDRRGFVVGGTAFAVTISEALLAYPARSQGVRKLEIIKVIGESTLAAEDILDFVSSVPRPDLDKEKFSPETKNQTIARNLISALGSLENTDLLEYVRPEHFELSQKMLNSDVPLVPKLKEIPPLRLSTDQIQAQEGEELTDVLIDILFAKFGLDKTIRLGFKRVIKQLNLEDIMKEIGNAAREKKYLRLSKLLRVLLNRLLGHDGLAYLEKLIGRKVLRKFLITVGARFVPFVGWPLLGVSCLYVFSDNWSRLEKAK